MRQKDGIAPVAKLLNSPNPDIQTLAAHAIANISLQGIALLGLNVFPTLC